MQCQWWAQFRECQLCQLLLAGFRKLTLAFVESHQGQLVLGVEWPVRWISRAVMLRAGGLGFLDMDHQGIGCHIAQALIAGADQCSDETQQVKQRESIGGAQQVADQTAVETERAAVGVDHSNAHGFLAGGLAMAQGFEQGGVKPFQGKADDQQQTDAHFAEQAEHNGQYRENN